MNNIRIHRCTGELATKYQGYIEPEDKSWRVFVDVDGFPHFLVRTRHSEHEGEGEPPESSVFTAMANIDTFLHEDMGSVREVMENTFCGPSAEPDELTDEDHALIRVVDFGPDCHTLSA